MTDCPLAGSQSGVSTAWAAAAGVVEQDPRATQSDLLADYQCLVIVWTPEQAGTFLDFAMATGSIRCST